MYPDDLKYSEEHEWIKVEGDSVTIGITHHAQDALGDVVFVELPEVGDSLEKEDTCGSIESVKAVSDLFCPLSGEVTAVNETLEDAPETVNGDPYAAGWIFKIKLSDLSELDGLMDAAAYQAFLKENE
jgi:glycine cleavage system H protein